MRRFFAIPFPIVIAAAALLGFVANGIKLRGFEPSAHAAKGGRNEKAPAAIDAAFDRAIPDHVKPSFARLIKVSAIGLTIWLAPLVVLWTTLGYRNVFTAVTLFNSKMAVVTFGGAYAVLAYMAQQAVEHYHWLMPQEMLVGLGFAETTPGHLISVVQFVGFMAAFRQPGALSPGTAGMLGGLLAAWATFVPSFVWIFMGVPYIESVRSNKALGAALAAITAAVVGVILNLAIWFCAGPRYAQCPSACAFDRGHGRAIPLQNWNDSDSAWVFDRGNRLPLHGLCLMHIGRIRITRTSCRRGAGLAVAAAVLAGSSIAGYAAENASAVLAVEAKIPLGDIRGRIDHLAVDVPRHRLYVAELGNDSLGVVDLEAGKTIRTLNGLREPQGIGYESTTDTVYVANAGDGSVRIFRGSDLAPTGRIALGSDADNVRTNEDGSRVFVGYGDGALAVIDPKTQRRLGDIPLKAHPESFRLEVGGSRIFVNVPNAHAIAILDKESRREIETWPTRDLEANFPLVLDESGHVFAVFRHPARVGIFDGQHGRLLSTVETCRDSDDVFIDPKRSRLYVICGEGFVDTYAQDKDQLTRISRFPTAGGARTGLFVTETDRLYIATPASLGHRAAIWVVNPGG
ncbi:MAG TPA: chromate transporter [Steroidobacteraceae bacterium]|jgi:chromate transport protein ChrA/DNA-binding beta-propeller fold protein YncE